MIVAFGHFLELQAELHRRIEKAVDRLERNDELFRNAAERQADFKALLGHDEVPELVLQDNGHLFRILRAQPLGQPHAVGFGIEGDIEMMLAGQALFGRVGEHGAHHAAQRLLGQKVIAYLVGHGRKVRDSLGMLAHSRESVIRYPSSEA